MACLLLGGMMAWAQKAAPAVGCMYEGLPFNNASANGKWLVSNVQSAVYIFDVDGNKVYEFMDENYVDAYFAGYGRSVTNDGMVVGMMQKLVDPETYTSETNAAYFKNGEWVVLPQMSGVKAGMNAAHACTPDGRVICGALAPDGVNLGSSGQALLFPVVWTRGADNQYVCEKLPCPEKDFTGRFPQYITAMDISDDGNAIVGQIRDYSGFYIVPILYNRNSEGQWSYQVVAGDVVYDAEKFKNLPAWKESPDYPEQGDYITDFVGPLGKATEIEGLKKVCVVGGGVGCAIAYPIAKVMHEAGVEVTFIGGFRSADIVILKEELAAVSDKLIMCTDDGSYGEKGFTTQYLKQEIDANIAEGKPQFDRVIAIGPDIMMKFLADVTRPYGIKTIISLDPIMVDGTGMCGGCRVIVGGETKFACVDGPDFDAHEVDFDSLLKRAAFYKDEQDQAAQHICNMTGGKRNG